MAETNIEHVSQNFKCPNCGHIETYSGQPNERIIVTCASCGTRGRITLSEI